MLLSERRCRTCHIKCIYVSMYYTLLSVSKMAFCFLYCTTVTSKYLVMDFYKLDLLKKKKKPNKNKKPTPLEKKKLHLVSLCHNCFYSLLKRPKSQNPDSSKIFRFMSLFLTEKVFLQQPYSGWGYVRFLYFKKKLKMKHKKVDTM